MFKIFTPIAILLALMAGCQTPFSEGDISNIVRWTTRLELVVGDAALLSDSPVVKQWASDVGKLLGNIKVKVQTGELTSVPSLVQEVRALKPGLVAALKEAGVKDSEILAILTGLEIALVGLEESL